VFILNGQNNISERIYYNIQDTTNFEGVYLSSVAFADIDNDNDQDILMTGQNIYDIEIANLYLNDGAGNFTKVTDTPFEGVYRSSIAFADVDNDNDQDVIITGINNSSDRTSKLYLNDSNGNFTVASNTTFVAVDLGSIAFADIDNDDDMDVLITGDGNSGFVAKLYINDGNGIFTELVNTPFDGVVHSSIAFSDIDNDDDQDVIISGFTGSNQRIAKLYLNDSNGNFYELTDTPFDGVIEGSVAFVDIENDNDLDLLITGLNSSFEAITKLYKNDGLGNYTEEPDTYFSGVYQSSIAISDIDNDSDHDILITGQNGYVSNLYIAKLYRNDGNGNYSEVSGTPFIGVHYGSVAFTDVDNDGNQDLLITGGSDSGPTAILYNDANNIPVNINNNLLLKKILYPNPTNGIINLNDVSDCKDIYINIRNLNGKLIKQISNFGGQNISFEVEGDKGIYFIEIITENKRSITKLIKN
jgi:predicted nucleotidyltransferase